MKRLVFLLPLLPLLMCCSKDEEITKTTRSAVSIDSTQSEGVSIQIDAEWDDVNKYEF